VSVHEVVCLDNPFTGARQMDTPDHMTGPINIGNPEKTAVRSSGEAPSK
jgi:hypothetical protein